LSGGFALESAVEEDLPALIDLERACFSQPWSLASFRGAIQQGPGRVVVLREPHGPRDAGRGLLAYCVFQVVLDELQVLDLAVRPERRRQGVGRRLLARVLELGAKRGARIALLEVRRSNWPALELYRSAGFELYDTRRDYYSSPREDALLLRQQGLEALRPRHVKDP
jgi:ribosomal-protein-alanine N-acetyltransferase